MQVYLWCKALHIAAVVVWISGIVVAGLAVASRTDIPATQDVRWLDAIRGWDRRVTLPAMLLVWGLGLTMAMVAGWFSSPWLMIKLAIVATLAALHGMLSGRLRRPDRNAERNPAALLYAAPATLLAVALIVILAVTKPF